MAAHEGIKTIVRWRGNTRLVTFEDERLAHSIERVLEEEPPGEVQPIIDFPPGSYFVRSRSAMLAGQPGGWHVRLDFNTGQHIGTHNCPYRAERSRENYPCRHIALATLQWKAERDSHIPYLRRIAQAQMTDEEDTTMPEGSTALAPYEPRQQLMPYVPTREEVANTMALAKVLMETRGAAIPQSLDSPAKVAAVIMAGRELGYEPMTALRNLYVINGVTQPNAQAIAGLIQSAGGDLVYHEMSDEAADVELIRPGRASLRIRYTLANAQKAGLTKRQRRRRKDGSSYEADGPWQLFPADMLIWKAVTRLGRRGAADIINGLEASMVRLGDVTDLTPHDSVIHEHEHNGHGPSDQVAPPEHTDDDETDEPPPTDEEPPDADDWPQAETEASAAAHAPADDWQSLTFRQAINQPEAIKRLEEELRPYRLQINQLQKALGESPADLTMRGILGRLGEQPD